MSFQDNNKEKEKYVENTANFNEVDKKKFFVSKKKKDNDEVQQKEKNFFPRNKALHLSQICTKKFKEDNNSLSAEPSSKKIETCKNVTTHNRNLSSQNPGENSMINAINLTENYSTQASNVNRTFFTKKKNENVSNKTLNLEQTKNIDKDDLSIEQKFYYLRLMAKPGKKPAPIKMKFVRWSSPNEKNLSVDDEGVLESQAMRVVRTIGQAFEVCYKISQDQMQEKQHLEDAESTSNFKTKLSTASAAIAEEVENEEIEKNLSRKPSAMLNMEDVVSNLNIQKTENNSQSSSPVQMPLNSLKFRQSIYIPRENSSDNSLSQEETIAANAIPFTNAQQKNIENGDKMPGVAAIIPTCLTLPNISTLRAPVNVLSQGHHLPSFAIASHSNNLPHSYTWHNSTLPSNTFQSSYQSQLIPPFPSIQTLDGAVGATSVPICPFYAPQTTAILPISAPGSYGLNSPMVVSPYATLQLPNLSTKTNNSCSNNFNETGTSTFDQYNIIRTQLDYAQQSAQVANCQVQYLRDQLNSETTARIEAQSSTNQLLNFNRDLIDQIKILVTRLQKLETYNEKLKTGCDDESIKLNQYSTLLSTHQKPSYNMTFPSQLIYNNPITSSSITLPDKKNSLTSTATHLNLILQNQAMPQQPYQVQTLADLRAGSLPPEDDIKILPAITIKKTLKKRPLATGDDSGVRTEPESATEDTTDYSSSDQFEKLNKMRSIEEQTNIKLFCPTTSKNISSQQIPAHYNMLLNNTMSGYLQNSLTTSKAMYPLQQMNTIQQQTPSQTYVTLKNQQNCQHNNQTQLQHPQQQVIINEMNNGNNKSTTIRQTSPKRQLRRFSLQALQKLIPDDFGSGNDSNESGGKKVKHGSTGIFKEKNIGFSRMSFNTRLNKPPKNLTPTSAIDALSEVPEEDNFSSHRNERRSSSDLRRRSLGIGVNSINTSGVQLQQIDAEPATVCDALPYNNYHRQLSTNQRSVAESAINQRAPASSSLATAMYPSKKGQQQLKPLPDALRKGGFQALSIDLNESMPVAFIFPTNAPYSSFNSTSNLTKTLDCLKQQSSKDDGS